MLLVSFCIATYNHEKYIYNTLQSVIDCHFNFSFEIIIGDDKSNDNTQQEIDLFIKDHPGNDMTVISRQVNVGVTDNYFDMLSKGKGKYFLCLDGDDYLLPEHLSFEIKGLLEDSDACLLFSYKKYYTDTDTFDAKKIHDISLAQSLDGVYFHISSMLLHKRIIKSVLSYKWMQNFNFLDRLIQIEVMRDKNYKVMSDVYLSVYRQHAVSLSRQMSAVDTLHSTTRFLTFYYGSIKRNLNTFEKSIFLKRIQANYLIFFHPLHCSTFKEFSRKIKESTPLLQSNVSWSFSATVIVQSFINYLIKVPFYALSQKRLINN